MCVAAEIGRILQCMECELIVISSKRRICSEYRKLK